MSNRYQSAGQLVQLLAERWTLAVLGQLCGVASDTRRSMTSWATSPTRCFPSRSAGAERDGLIARHLDPCRIETATIYEMTDLGRSLDVPLASMTEWADTNWDSVRAGRQRWHQLRRAGG
jgi:HxlR-like helix-turn-helix